jgi:hypothetical protein
MIFSTKLKIPTNLNHYLKDDACAAGNVIKSDFILIEIFS